MQTNQVDQIYSSFALNFVMFTSRSDSHCDRVGGVGYLLGLIEVKHAVYFRFQCVIFLLQKTLHLLCLRHWGPL